MSRLFFLILTCGVLSGFSQDEAAIQLKEEAVRAHEAEEVQPAIDLYRKALEADPTWARGWWNLGTIYYALDAFEAAGEAFQKLLQLRPESGPGWALLGLTSLSLGQFDVALDSLQKSRKLGAGDDPILEPVVRFNLALLNIRAGEFETARSLLLEFVQEGNRQPSVLEALGLVLMRLPVLPSDVDPSQADMVRSFGEAGFYILSGDSMQARDLLGALLQRYPDIPEGRLHLGDLLVESEVERAIELWNQEARRFGPRPEIYHRIAKAQLKAGNLAGASAAADRALNLDATHPRSLSLVSECLLAGGRPEEAFQLLSEAVKQNPHDEELLSLLSRARAVLEDRKE